MPTDVMFEENEDGTRVQCTSPKLKVSYSIVRENSGYPFYRFIVEKGAVAGVLSGRFSSMPKAIETFKSYEAGLAISKSIKRDAFKKVLDERNAPDDAETS